MRFFNKRILQVLRNSLKSIASYKNTPSLSPTSSVSPQARIQEVKFTTMAFSCRLNLLHPASCSYISLFNFSVSRRTEYDEEFTDSLQGEVEVELSERCIDYKVHNTINYYADQ